MESVFQALVENVAVFRNKRRRTALILGGVIVSTNYQYPITDRFGILGGIGASGSTNSNPYVRFEFNLGLVFRLMSR